MSESKSDKRLEKMVLRKFENGANAIVDIFEIWIKSTKPEEPKRIAELTRCIRSHEKTLRVVLDIDVDGIPQANFYAYSIDGEHDSLFQINAKRELQS